MKQLLTKTSFIIIITLTFVLNATFFAYSYYDDLTNTENEVLTIGTWSFLQEPLGTIVSDYLQQFVDDAIAADPNSPLQYIYTQDGSFSRVEAVVTDVSLYNYDWTVTGTGTSNPTTTMGFVQLVDRSVDETSTPIHDILPTYETVAPFPEYSFFTAYDVVNTVTNNLYSIRLNYDVELVSEPITNLSAISFYASIGLEATNDSYNIDPNRTFTVEVSQDGINWTVLGENTPSNSTTDYNYSFFHYDVPVELQNTTLYVKISFNGEGYKVGRYMYASRMIIDELTITTN
jgi:hypothetical protein